MTYANKTSESIRAFRTPIVPAEIKVSKVPSTSFADLVRMLAESIADAQLSLDRASAEMLTELAETRERKIRKS